MSHCQPFDTEKELINYAVKNYHALHYLPQLQEIFALVNPKKDYSLLSKFELHKRINKAIIGSYHGEQNIKYFLFKEFRNKDLIAAFEMNVQSSRLDFLTINGVTTSYEIKSSLDTLSKLSKQSSDYLKAFEFNNIVVDQRHLKNALEIIPEHFGVYTFYRGKKKTIQKGSFNYKIDAEFQIKLLSKKELKVAFGVLDKGEIIYQFDPVTINIKFKQALKARYQSRWQFITSRYNEILPLDVQFFFNSNVEPLNIYA